VAMLTIGVLIGLQPIFGPRGSEAASVQAALVASLQLSMAMIGLLYQPDADRVISCCTGIQFLLEGTSTGLLLGASLTSERKGQLRLEMLAFVLALIAVAIPILTLIEERLVSPLVLIWRNGKAHKLSFAAGLYMLVVGLRKQVFKLIAKVGMGAAMPEARSGATPTSHPAGMTGEGVANEAMATDASPGEDGHEAHGQASNEARAEKDSSGPQAAPRFDADVGAADDEGAAFSASAQVSAHEVVEVTGTKGGALVARAFAAKEVDLAQIESRKRLAGRERLKVLGKAVRSSIAASEESARQRESVTDSRTQLAPRQRMRVTAVVPRATRRACKAAHHQHSMDIDDDDGDDPMDGAGGDE